MEEMTECPHTDSYMYVASYCYANTTILVGDTQKVLYSQGTWCLNNWVAFLTRALKESLHARRVVDSRSEYFHTHAVSPICPRAAATAAAAAPGGPSAKLTDPHITDAKNNHQLTRRNNKQLTIHLHTKRADQCMNEGARARTHTHTHQMGHTIVASAQTSASE